MIQTTFNNKRIFVAGHTGMVGSAIVRLLNNIDCEILTVSSQELDLKQSSKVDKWFDDHRPDAVFLAAAKVGGILANSSYPADFLIDNLSIQNSVITNAFKYKVKKLMFLGSSCIYPRNAKQPIKESSLLTGILEPTNEAYAIANIAGIKLCQFYRKQYGVDYVSVMPTNLYGPGDNFHPKNSHVVAALISKFYEAVKLNKEEVILWGTGKPLREFMHVDDLAEGLIFLMEIGIILSILLLMMYHMLDLAMVIMWMMILSFIMIFINMILLTISQNRMLFKSIRIYF